MEDINWPDLVASAFAIAILLGGFLLMLLSMRAGGGKSK